MNGLPRVSNVAYAPSHDATEKMPPNMFLLNVAPIPIVALTSLCFISPTSAIGDWGDYLATSKTVEVLEGPDARFPARTELEEGRLVVELDRIREFVQVRIPDKSHLSGWIRAKDLVLIRKWAKAADYPDGHPAAKEELKFGSPREEESQPQQDRAGLWSLVIAATIVAAALVLVWQKRLRMRLATFGTTRLKPTFFRIRASVCKRICGARMTNPEGKSDKS